DVSCCPTKHVTSTAPTSIRGERREFKSKNGAISHRRDKGSGVFYDGKTIHTTCLRVHAGK
ncbi:MAG: hypothetical protein ACE5JU_10315, partial [Candidatus Binatia bacterium]